MHGSESQRLQASQASAHTVHIVPPSLCFRHALIRLAPPRLSLLNPTEKRHPHDSRIRFDKSAHVGVKPEHKRSAKQGGVSM
ncbi:hypothetical protein GMOD_00010059 [Pyrenophora seminiperda CCB06]|uniref:Uncharacterized protein n=1 Tax=Pyrenophora seminiperda CCB06 TaxID=1302712 RepID=A0A3M7M1Z0_9PLEO|nr:hypothetical protein GMOD_00010059 [Pyrenophora seminiperda CCB06]